MAQKRIRSASLLLAIAILMPGCRDDARNQAVQDSQSLRESGSGSQQGGRSTTGNDQLDPAADQQGGDSNNQHGQSLSSAISAPPGFSVTRYAGDDLAHDVTSMAIDAQGRVVVSGPGYVKILHDDNNDGTADRATNFCEYPGSGAHGMLFLGSDLLCNGDRGLRLLRDSDGDGRWDGRASREEWMQVNHPEHGANGIIQGPDGWIYMICGNDAGVTTDHVTAASSPLVNSIGGTLLRISTDGSQTQVIGHGFRNPYDVAFTEQGNILTVDSDGERDQYLPWYSPTRMFDVAIGGEHGWLLRGWQRSWNRPEEFFDNTQRLAEFGRGSPTGLVVYRHHQFPEEYRGGAFSACWTLGRVYFVPLKRDAADKTATYERAEPQVFLRTVGDVGFAPVDLAVGPEGDLFIAIGGRGTQGGVFRVSYQDAKVAANVAQRNATTDALSQVLDAPQPLASWSRAKWLPAARGLGPNDFLQVAWNEDESINRRRRAIEILTEVFGGVDIASASELESSPEPAVRAAMAWSAGRSGAEPHAVKLLARLTYDESPDVARAAWEGLLISGQTAPLDEPPAWVEAAKSDSRRIRSAMIQYALSSRGGAISNADRAFTLLQEAAADPRVQAAILRLHLGQDNVDWQMVFDAALAIFANTEDHDLRLTALRLMQRAVGDVLLANNGVPHADGYIAAAAERVSTASLAGSALVLSVTFPTQTSSVNREIARTIAMLGQPAPSFLEKLPEMWNDTSLPAEDLHYLIAASRVLNAQAQTNSSSTKTMPEGFAATVATTLVNLSHKMGAADQIPSRNWPQRVGELTESLFASLPGLPKAIVAADNFGRVDHGLFVKSMPGEDRAAGVRRLLETTLSDDLRFTDEARPGYESWTPALVSLLTNLPPDEAAPHLEAAWNEYALRDAALAILAKSPQDKHRAKYLEALESFQPSVVNAAIDALVQLSETESNDQPTPASELAQLLSALRQACLMPGQRRLRQKIVRLFERKSGESFDADESQIGELGSNDDGGVTARLFDFYKPCFAWLAATHPASATAANSPFAAQDWSARLTVIDWSSGDAVRGQAFYERKTCARCHDGAGRLGPELRGAAGRFSREDLLASIVDPNRDVAPLYQTTVFETGDGQVYQGLVVYESPEGTLVQISPDEIIRISGTEIRSQQPNRRSLMPTGLLDDATDQNLADLDAYLRSLSGQ